MFALMILAMGAEATPQNFNSDNVVRCVREEIIGSLARTRRTCHTMGEWRAIRARANDEARRIINPSDPNGAGNGDSPTQYDAARGG